MTTAAIPRGGLAPVGAAEEPHHGSAQIAALEAEIERLRLENEKLRRKETRLVQIMDALPGLVGYVDLDLRIVFSNRLIESWYRRPRADLEGMELRSLLSNAHYEAVQSLLERVLDGEEINEEREITYPDGVTRIVHLNYIPDRVDGRIDGYYFLVRDVTERKQAEEALRRSNEELDRRIREATAELKKRNTKLRREISARRRSEEQYRVVSDMTSDLVYAYHIEADGRMVVDWSAGRLSHAFAPIPYGDGHHRMWRPIVHPDDLPILDRRIERLCRNEPSVDEFRVIDLDGLLRWLRVYGKPVWSEREQRVVRIMVAAQDITERKLAEDELHSTQELLTEALEAMSDGFMLFGPDGRLVTSNERMRTMFPRSAPLFRPGMRFEELLLHSASAGEVKDAIGRPEEWVAERMAEYPSVSGANEVELSDGRWILSTDRPTRDGGVVGIRTDITERKRFEDNLRRREAEMAHVLRRASMGEMASALAHELSQPLAAVVNYASGTLRRLEGPDPDLDVVRDALDRTRSAANRAKSIVRHVADFVRHGRPEVAPENLVTMIRDVCALADGALRRGRVQLVTELPPEPLMVTCNRIELEQVILNLIRNAIDAMREEGRTRRVLSITCAAHGPATCGVAVRDTGPGVAADLVARVFDPYVTTKPDGLGMGLSISRTIIEAHGGRLWVDNTEDGAVFRFVLPRSERKP